MPTDTPETMSDEMALGVHDPKPAPVPGPSPQPSTSQPRPPRPSTGKPYQAVTGRFTTKSQRIRYFLMQKEKLDSILLSLHTGCGVEFCLNMLDEDGTMWVSNSEDAASWNQWTKSKETFPAHITMARWERERDALTASHQQDLGLFTLEQQRTIVATLIATVIPNQETWFPYNKARTQAVAQAFAWWPADVDYQDPQAMNAQELRKVFDAALAGNKQLEHHIKREIGKLGLSSAEHELLHRLVSAGVRDAHEIVAIPPAPGTAAGQGLRAVDQFDQHVQDFSGWPSVDYPPSFGGGIAEPEVEVGPDDKLYLGAGPTNSESIKRCIESHGIGFLKKKMVCVKIAGTEVGLAHFYNAVLAMGGINQVRGKIDQERALARELLISPQASKNWRKLMWEAWDRVFPKITHGGSQNYFWPSGQPPAGGAGGAADDTPKPPGPLQLSDVTARPNTADTLAALAALPAPEAHDLEMSHNANVRPNALNNHTAAAAMALLRAAIPGMGAPPPSRPTPRKRHPHGGSPSPDPADPHAHYHHPSGSQPGSPTHGGSGSPPRGPTAPAEDAAAAAELVLQAAAAAAATQNPGMGNQPMLTAAALVATEALMAGLPGLDAATAERLAAAAAATQNAAAVVHAAEVHAAAAKANEAAVHDHEAAVAAQQHHEQHAHHQGEHQHQEHQGEHQEAHHQHHHQQHAEEDAHHQQQHAAAVAAAVAQHAAAAAAAAEHASMAALHEQQHHVMEADMQQHHHEQQHHEHHHLHPHHAHHHHGEAAVQEGDTHAGPAPRRSARNEGKENPLLAAVVPKKRNRMEAEAAAAAKRVRPDGED